MSTCARAPTCGASSSAGAGPNLRSAVRALDVISPADLGRANVDAVDGDPCGGSAQLDQAFLWRPLAGSGRHRTAVPGLWHLGASTHPGAGLGGGSGHLVAQQLTARRLPDRVRASVQGSLSR